jgi:hypothetical protein
MVLTLDIGGAVPTTPTSLIDAQLAAEVLRSPTPNLVNAQTAAEVIRRPTPSLVNAQTAVEVLRPSAAVASGALPQVFVCT